MCTLLDGTIELSDCYMYKAPPKSLETGEISDPVDNRMYQEYFRTRGCVGRSWLYHSCVFAAMQLWPYAVIHRFNVEATTGFDASESSFCSVP